jgi:hypothetical protein
MEMIPFFKGFVFALSKCVRAVVGFIHRSPSCSKVAVRMPHPWAIFQLPDSDALVFAESSARNTTGF